MENEEIILIARKMVSEGKGILAADESTATITKRLDTIGVESNFDNRNEYRDMLFRTNKLSNFVSGIIMYDETIRQRTTCKDKVPFTEYLNSKGIIPGIKVDTGAKDLCNFKNEKITEGLDGLRERLKEYYKIGARFAKWRAVITINNNKVSKTCIESNAQSLARYSALCQEQGIVPIVEPEVLMEGNHTIEICKEITKQTLDSVFKELKNHRVNLKAIVLKPNMIISALKCEKQADIETVSSETYKVLKNHVPEEVPGIAFLSGGQTSKLATAHLNMMNKTYIEKPWNLTFSYGRALQQNSLLAWKGENREEGQKELILRAEMNHLASIGKCEE